LSDGAEVVAAASRTAEAAEALVALETHERKRNLARQVAQVRPRLEAPRQTMPT
jgi:hypothetical protein